ncbi:MAG: dihydrolipoyl dehydrogenase [Lachnospiraceae bacterium]|nr:dihydrolipoyl dehydrogenase [Lachnospiraceae bacterium]
MEIVDVLVIGGGPGGYLCAERAAQGGLSVILFEKRALGGTCLNEGCIPTKTLLNSAKLYRHATESSAFGVEGTAVYHHDRVIARKNKVVKTLVAGVGATMRSNKVTVVKETAVIEGRTEEGFAVKAGDAVYTGRRLVIAAGSEANVPPIPGVKEGLASGFVVTNREILEETALPKHLIAIGGGVIGLEMACYFASVGTKVTVIEALPKIAGPTDPEICKVLMDTYGKRGMDFYLNCKVLAVTADGVKFEENGEEKFLACDKVLLSVGRHAASAGLGLDKLGVEMNRAAVVTDRHLCTSVPGVYAVGDVNGKIMLAHTAYREAEVAVNHMLGIPDEMRYEVIPSVIYTDPEVASVGLSLDEARKNGINAKETKLPMQYAGRYVAENERGTGFIKLVLDQDRRRLIGCHMVGSYASEIIMTAVMMIDTELSPSRLKKLVFPHPTVAEIIREALFAL